MAEQEKDKRMALSRRAVEPPPKERFEILLEEIRGDVKTVMEGRTVLDRKIDHLEDRMDERFTEADVKLGTLNKKIDEVNQSLGAKIDAVAQDLAEHRADTEAHPSGYKVSEG